MSQWNRGKAQKWSQWDRAFRVVLAIAAIAAVQPASAMDAVAAPLPSPIADSTVAIGARSLTLPAGKWTLVGRTDGALKNGTQVAQPYFTTYAINVDGAGLMKASVLTRLTANRATVDTSNEDPCRFPDGVFADLVHRQDIEANKHCLLVFMHRSHMETRDSDPLVGQAASWVKGAGLRAYGPVYEISYANYASDDFGWVRVVVPVGTFGSQAQAISWAQQLPAALGEMLANRTATATLPALPTQGGQR